MAENGGKRRGGGGWLIVLVLLAGAGLAAWLWTYLPEGAEKRFVYLCLLLAFVTGSLLWGLRRAPLSRSLRHAAIWLVLGGVLFVGYSFRDEVLYVVDRVQGDLTPERGYGATEREISFRAGPGGHYTVEAMVDGVPVVFLVDTGASEVVLTLEDARRLGFDPGKMTFSRTYQTANGTVRGAPVMLQKLAIGPIVVENVRASVNSAPMEGSLLGMTFLSRIGGYSVSGDVLTLQAK
jgi:aspartyl protease family protein